MENYGSLFELDAFVSTTFKDVYYLKKKNEKLDEITELDEYRICATICLDDVIRVKF